MDFSRIDTMATHGYEYAAQRGKVPKLKDQMDIDAFNAGISNFNIRNGAHIAPLLIRTRKFSDGANGRVADKELAIVGA